MLIGNQFPQFRDSDGTALNAGYVYFGTINLNPETNPIAVYWDAALTQPAAQPIRTLNGYIVRDGAIANIYAPSTYSITVKNKNGILLYSLPNSVDFDSNAALPSSLSSGTGSSLMGWIRSATGAVLSTLYQWLDWQAPSIAEFMTDAQRADCKSGAATIDCSAAVQAAINFCIANNVNLRNPYKKVLLSSTVNIDRQVDGAAFDSYFTIHGGGFYVRTAINMFSSSIAFSGNPVSQLVKFNGVNFESANSTLAAYVFDGAKFLRSCFESCDFIKIKCLNATTYVQTLYFINCNARRWTGTFFKATPQGYDIQVIGGLYEAGDAAFDISSPIGCKFWTQIEGMTGTALKINGAQSVDISCYLEANGLDIDCRTGGLANYGINLHGSYIAHTAGTGYSVKWGTAYGCVSKGNWHTGDMHDLQSDSFVEINDKAQGNLSNGDAATHRGYRESSAALALSIRGSSSASYTVSAVNSKYTINGRLVTVHFTCTLTSNATNPADQIYILAGLPETSSINGVLCGNLEVVGSAQNGGVSPAFVSSVSPFRVLSSITILPANVSGNSWTVRGCLVYSTTS